MKTNLNTTTVILDYLKSNTSLSSMIGGRFVRIVAEQGVLYPFITVTRTSLQPSRGNKDFGEQTHTIQIQVLTRDYDVSIAEKVIEILDDTTIVKNDIQYDIQLQSASEQWAENAYVQTIMFGVTVSS